MAETLRIGDIVATNYRVVSHLGEGGFGTVFLAENLTLGEQKAVVKVLRDVAQGAGAAEARMLAALEHPNVVHVYAYDEKFDCIVMQYLSGVSLHELVEALHPVTAVRVAQATALALSAVHAKGLVHRDVKPQNVMAELKGPEVAWVKLIDFGIAQTIGKVSKESAGTVEYCGPELFQQTPAHPGNDVYSLGVMLFELCAHQHPFSGTVDEVIDLHLRGTVPNVLETRKRAYGPGTSSVLVEPEKLEPRVEMLLERVDELVRSMMAKDLSQRPDAQTVARRLDEVEREFSNETTQVGYQLPVNPILLTRRAKSTTTVLPKLAAPAAMSTAKTVAAMRESNSKRGPLIVALMLLVFGVAAAVFLKRDEVVVEPVVPSVALVVDAGSPVMVAAPVAAEPVAPPPEDLTPLPKIGPKTVVAKVSKPSKPEPVVDACVFSVEYRNWVRSAVAELHNLSGGGPAFEKLEDDVGEALNERDCRRANRSIHAMQKLAGVPQD